MREQITACVALSHWVEICNSVCGAFWDSVVQIWKFQLLDLVTVNEYHWPTKLHLVSLYQQYLGTFIWAKHTMDQGPSIIVKYLDLQSESTINKWGWAHELFVSKLDIKFPAIAEIVAHSFTLNYWTELFHFVPLFLVKWKYRQRGNTTIFDKEIICSGLERPGSNLSIWPIKANTNKILRSSGAH